MDARPAAPVGHPDHADAWTIGADPTCTIRIDDDDQVEAFHALAFRTPDGSCWIVDLGQHSAPHGTWVRVHGGLFTRVGVPERLRVGYMLRIGRTELPWRTP